MSAPPPGQLAARTSLLYKISLLLVAIAMSVLPCLYVAIMVLTGYGVYYFAVHEFPAIWAWPGGYNRVTLAVKTFCSFTPLLVGGSVAFSMVKPLFARRSAHMQPLALNPAVEPRVYELVQSVCHTLRAPMPRRIELNCDLNASAGFDQGLGGFFGNRLILTLGLPLVAGMTQRELAGVIAHEFGHFRQCGGMRLSYLIRKVNGWFARVVYERDSWDELLDSWKESADSATISFMLLFAQMGVGCARGVLWALMMIGHLICAVLMRQMEYDADRNQIAIAGSAAFESALVKLTSLAKVLRDIHLEMRRSWRSHFQLPENLPVLVEHRVERLPAEARARNDAEAVQGRTELLATHPSTRDRVRRAQQLAEPGYHIADEPARKLFEHFENLSRLVTLAHYEDDLNVPTTADFLIPLEKIIGAEHDEKATATPAATPARPVVPKMVYDPSKIPKRPL